MANGGALAPGINELIVTDSNKYAFEKVLHITEDHDAPARLFLYGARGSGKTTLVQARLRDRDLLSRKELRYCHVGELVSFFNLEEAGEQILEKIGSADVLFLDGLELILSDDSLAGKLCSLLLEARNNAGSETVVISSEPFSEYANTEVHAALDGYEHLHIEPLGATERVLLAKKTMMALKRGQDGPSLTDGAAEYLASTISECDRLKKAVEYLMTSAGFTEGYQISAEEAHNLIG